MDHLYSKELNPDSLTVPMSAELTAHCRALRLNTGQCVSVLNGRGLVASCTAKRNATEVVLDVDTVVLHDQSTAFWLGVGALGVRDRLEYAIEKATELGATRISVIRTDNSQEKKISLERLVAKCTSAITQSGNPWLPEVDFVESVDDYIERIPKEFAVVVGDASGSIPARLGLQGVVVMVGPEGGFTTREMNLLAGDPRTRLWQIGTQRLRTETATVSLLTAAVLNIRST